MLDVLDSLATFVEAQAATPWALVVVLLVAALDAVFPPVPSESVIVAVAAVSVAGDGPSLWVLGAVAAVGAFVGDTAVFLLGRRYGQGGLARLARRRLLGRAVDLARHTLATRGGLVVVLARYVPAGRVAVALTAGATGYPPRRFAAFAALAAVSWSAWTVGIGALAGRWSADNPVLGALVGVGVALVLGLALDRVVRVLLPARTAGTAGTARDEDAGSAGAPGSLPVAARPVPATAARLHSRGESANNDG